MGLPTREVGPDRKGTDHEDHDARTSQRLAFALHAGQAAAPPDDPPTATATGGVRDPSTLAPAVRPPDGRQPRPSDRLPAVSAFRGTRHSWVASVSQV